MLNVDKQPEWEHPIHGVFSPNSPPKAVDNISRLLRKPRKKVEKNETLSSRRELQQPT